MKISNKTIEEVRQCRLNDPETKLCWEGRVLFDTYIFVLGQAAEFSGIERIAPNFKHAIDAAWGEYLVHIHLCKDCEMVEHK